MSDAPTTVPALIDAFGGPTGFARVIGKGPSTASEQKRSGSVPVEYWDLIVLAARDAGIPGVSFEALARMHIPEERRVAAEARV
jgi:hypothetical protein